MVVTLTEAGTFFLNNFSIKYLMIYIGIMTSIIINKLVSCAEKKNTQYFNFFVFVLMLYIPVNNFSVMWVELNYRAED